MDFWDLTKLLVRRWYISVTLLLVTFGATAYAAVAIKPDYAITAYVQLIPPTAVSDPEKAEKAQNPWLALGITSLSNAAMVATQDQTFLDTLKVQDESASFEITIGDRNPVAIVEVIAPTLDQAVSATALITSHYEQSVAALQQQYGVKSADMITAYRLDKGENVKRPGGKVKRAVVVVFAIGILLTGGVTIMVDALLRRRRRSRHAAAESTAEPSTEQPVQTTDDGVPLMVRQRSHPDVGPPRNFQEPAEWEKTAQLQQFLQDPERVSDRDRKHASTGNGRNGGTVVISSTTASDATILLPRTPRAGEPGAPDDRGR
ncbi:hypothetical protein [Actinoplanes sp. NPDC051859]|uniref:hypothetical protein n=1 Tax=Actinoplanes sp. NPDC051859 TaxID=3363909 RepID=UPI0037B71A81